MFALITEKTGWTPSQIASLTISQLKLYISAWSHKDSSDESQSEYESLNPDAREIEAFNLAAGIDRIQKKK